MRLTLHTDYGFRLLVYLGIHDGRLVSAREVAEAYGIPHNHLTKIIPVLVAGGFMESVRGRGGGLRLAQKPEAINMGLVGRALQVNAGLLPCLKCTVRLEAKKQFCPLAGPCALAHMLDEATEAFMAVLGRRTLADMMGRAEHRILKPALGAS
ncbi:Rrf2 family transcriptional regulator [Formicincola oecophyllae]|uniref:Rrf2 family transcriptional regulator n=1 Tax=Formicincola oecophyllae TaxID=2558361 RepID=A0A4Y6U7H8_9PROT|nr:Rrf2 family transcriptional regulator [Formicincola oecophyllae]QDH13272.1 Rrf2 family transcriptional regulator [Formicincola oecophyllae]